MPERSCRAHRHVRGLAVATERAQSAEREPEWVVLGYVLELRARGLVSPRTQCFDRGSPQLAPAGGAVVTSRSTARAHAEDEDGAGQQRATSAARGPGAFGRLQPALEKPSEIVGPDEDEAASSRDRESRGRSLWEPARRTRFIPRRVVFSYPG